MTTKQIQIPETVPLVQWEDGSIRLRNSRLTLDLIVGRVNLGQTAEEIHDSFPSATVTQINEIRAWYFDNKAEADDYIAEGEREFEELRKKIESDPEYQARRQAMLRRKAELRKS